MKKSGSMKRMFGAVAVMLMGAMTLPGCETNAQTGALFGATFGALVGNAVGSHGRHGRHGSSGSGALIGAAIGGGLGYAIGNEEDKRERSGYTTYYSRRPVYTTRVITTREPYCVRESVVVERKRERDRSGWRGEAGDWPNPLVGTSWKVVNVTGDHRHRGRIESAVLTFVDHQKIVAVRTRHGGRVESRIDGYRVVDHTLILELDGVLFNAQFVIEGDRLTLEGERFCAVLERVHEGRSWRGD